MQNQSNLQGSTFAIDDVPTVGLVMRDDQLIAELTAQIGLWSYYLSMPACCACRYARPDRK